MFVLERAGIYHFNGERVFEGRVSHMEISFILAASRKNGFSLVVLDLSSESADNVELPEKAILLIRGGLISFVHEEDSVSERFQEFIEIQEVPVSLGKYRREILKIGSIECPFITREEARREIRKVS